MDYLKSAVSSVQHSTSKQVEIALAAVAVIVVARWATKKRYKLPPGPTPLPLLGNILEFRGVPAHDKFEEWKMKYGPVVLCQIGPVPLVVLNDADTINEAFVKQGSDFSGRPHLYSMDILTEGSKDIAFATYGETWKYQRKIAAQALRQYLTGTQLEERVHETLKPITDTLRTMAEPFDPSQYMTLCVFNVLHGLCFGSTKSLEDPAFLELTKIGEELIEKTGDGFLEDFFPLLRLFPTKRFRRTVEIIDKFNNYIHERLDEHKATFSEDNVNSLTDNIILAQQQALKEDDPALAAMFTDTHAAQIIADVFGAGVDTTRITLRWFFLVMASHPDIQEKIHQELEEVVGDGIPGKEHRSKLVYLEAALLEAMRLYYVVPLGVPHETMRDTTVGGYEIPAKTMVMTNNIAVMMDPKYWEDPLIFKPERFIDASKTKIVTRNKSWIPFSLGHRSCLGESLAKLEMVYVIAGLLQALKFSLPDGAEPDYSPNVSGFLSTPKPYKVIVTARGNK